MRRGVTLIELLITMAIMAIISAAILGTASAAMESARRDRTRVLITKISGLVNEIAANYETRRVSPHPDYAVSIRHSFAGTMQGMATQDVRLIATRELMKYEMPDRWTDVTDDPQILSSVPSVAYTYRRFAAKLDPAKRDINQSAECLYLTVMALAADGEARTLFSKQDIGDTDEDGASEFIDGWGNAIGWVRWPAHFNKTTLVGGAAQADADHDPFDMFRRDQAGSTGPNPTQFNFPPGHTPAPQINVKQAMTNELPGLRDPITAYRLLPLVYSRGPDAASDINVGADNAVASLNPYNPDTEVGMIKDTNDDGDDNSIDNITNHVMEY